MSKLSQEFISPERRKYRMALGHDTATALSGFIAGAVVASLIFLSGIFVSSYFFQ